MKITAAANAAFTLVELSIVLVIIGLLTGGILAGQSLIRAAELRAVTTEFNKYVSATQAFRDKYMALPGDINNATQFWGFAGTAAAPNCVSNSGITAITSTGTCDGNGDGTINGASVGGRTSETYQYWRQLASAGLLEGTYNGLAGATNGWTSILGTNAPKSKLTNAGWSAANWTSYGGDGSRYAYDYGNFLFFGAAITGDLSYGAILKPEEAWNIDTKLDDGQPHAGKIIAVIYTTCATTAAGGTAAQNDPATDIYKLTTTSPACSLAFIKPF